MKKSRTLIIILGIVLVGIVIYSMSSGESDENYSASIIKDREEKDLFMKNSDESPFADEKEEFKGLKYFEPNPDYRVIADLDIIENKKVVTLATSLQEENQYLEYGWVEFYIEGVKNKLLLLEIMASGPTKGTLFLAFADETSANLTYGAGRYLELKKMPGAGTMVLDFNKAYNPYCAYTDRFSCPFPPKENILKVSILAGEKNYHQ